MFLVDQSHDKFISKIRGFEDKELLFLTKIQKPKKLLLKELSVHLAGGGGGGGCISPPPPPPPTSDCFEVARKQALLRQESRRAMQAFKRSAKGAHV